MMQTKNLQGECQHCRGMFEFQAETAGTTAACPHCGQPTEMMPVLPADTESPMRTKAVVFTVIALVILLGELGGTLWALKRAKRISQRPAEAASASQTQPADPFAAAGFRVSPVTLEKGQASSLVHAVGTITNTANRSRFGLRVELELLDDAGNRVGSATDYRATLDPNTEWRFRALVVEKKAAAAKIAAIKEDQ